MLQYLQLEEERKAKTRTEKQSASSESSQIDVIKMQKKKCRFTNLSLRIQKRSKEGLLKILKGYRDLQRFVLKADRNNLKNFRSNLKPLRGSLKSFENASEGEVKFKAFSGDFNEDQLEAEWAQLRLKRVQ